MSPGTTCMIEIEFAPKINKDIDSSLPLLAETGPINIPIKCNYAKVSLAARLELVAQRSFARRWAWAWGVAPVSRIAPCSTVASRKDGKGG